jgi:hypothetical protein
VKSSATSPYDSNLRIIAAIESSGRTVFLSDELILKERDNVYKEDDGAGDGAYVFGCCER